MFKPFPDVVATQECGADPNAHFAINWEEIARWALENNNNENLDERPFAVTNIPQNVEDPIDWCSIADSFMRDEADAVISPIPRTHERPIYAMGLHYPSESMSRLVAEGYEDFPLPITHRESNLTPEANCPRGRRERDYSFISNSDLNRSMRDSDFNNTSCYDRTPLSSMPDFSCMENLHDSTEEYQSDIDSYLDCRAERNRPHSLAEGYHFPGRAYGTENNDDCKMYTSTPKKNQRTTRAETFELANGSKMFNVTFEECREFGRRLRHISDVTDSNGCQVMHMDREINEENNGASHRVDIARRWLDPDEDNCG